MRILVLLAISTSFGFVAEAHGSCGEFLIIITGNETGCWDAKVDAPGVILDEEWKSSFFYAKDAYCNGFGAVRFRAAMDADVTVKIRQKTTIIEAPIVIQQYCNSQTPDFFIVIILASALFAGIMAVKT
ncbi:MAG: hypothetical protein HY364_02915 [Candidatus Aenigmarchaeota archaeon]|nr:hypothetical protein [Candidatus Aenigmarchaeota archaeon]